MERVAAELARDGLGLRSSQLAAIADQVGHQLVDAPSRLKHGGSGQLTLRALTGLWASR